MGCETVWNEIQEAAGWLYKVGGPLPNSEMKETSLSWKEICWGIETYILVDFRGEHRYIQEINRQATRDFKSQQSRGSLTPDNEW